MSWSRCRAAARLHGVTLPDPGELPPPGRLVSDDDGERVQCHLCGAFFAKLGTHVARGHGMAPDDYRERFGLNNDTGLVSPALRDKLAAINRDHLARVRPRVSVFAALTAEQRAQNPRGHWREQRRLNQSGAMRRYHAEHPRPSEPKPDPLPVREVRARGRRRIAELRADPEWLGHWRTRVRAVSVRLTADQLREIAALRGTASRRELAERYAVSATTIVRIWRGEIRPDAR